MKHCGRCGECLADTAFNKGQSWCRVCMMAYKKRRRDLARGGPAREVWREFTGELVPCRRCGVVKPLTREFFRPGTADSNGAHIRKDCRECLNADRRAYNHKTPNIRAYYKLFQYQKYDRKKGLETSLSQADVLKLMTSACEYCGSLGDNGADRLDNTIGHTTSNCVACCVECNIARGDKFTPDEMRTFIGPAIRAAKESRK